MYCKWWCVWNSLKECCDELGWAQGEVRWLEVCYISEQLFTSNTNTSLLEYDHQCKSLTIRGVQSLGSLTHLLLIYAAFCRYRYIFRGVVIHKYLQRTSTTNSKLPSSSIGELHTFRAISSVEITDYLSRHQLAQADLWFEFLSAYRSHRTFDTLTSYLLGHLRKT